uniref:Uncharacterized protein n=1 Tax=Arundo donax TaxID=35708 RepID=A0A0A9CRI7_ARUDO
MGLTNNITKPRVSRDPMIKDKKMVLVQASQLSKGSTVEVAVTRILGYCSSSGLLASLISSLPSSWYGTQHDSRY